MKVQPRTLHATKDERPRLSAGNMVGTRLPYGNCFTNTARRPVSAKRRTGIYLTCRLGRAGNMAKEPPVVRARMLRRGVLRKSLLEEHVNEGFVLLFKDAHEAEAYLGDKVHPAPWPNF